MFRNPSLGRRLSHRYAFTFTSILLTLAVSLAGSVNIQAQGMPQLDSTHQLYLPTLSYSYPPCNDEPPPSVFGVQMYGNTSSSSPYHPALLDTGADWARASIYWESVEPQNVLPARFNWSHADTVVSAAAEACLNLIITHERAPSWAATYTNGEIDKVSLEEFKEYMGALVERYDGDGIADAPNSAVVNHWELYNEPDAGDLLNHTTWGTKGEKYAQMLAAVYPVIKKANPNAQILIGGIAYDWFIDDPKNPGVFVRSFLDDVLANGGGHYFDIMNIHAYPAFAKEWTDSNGPGLREKVEFVRNKLLNEYGLDKPLMITESGWHSNAYIEHSSTPEKQARYVVQLYAQGLAAKVEVLIYWMLHDPGGAYPFESGLVTNVNATVSPLTPKPAFEAYKVIRTLLSNATYQRSLTPGELKAPEMEAHRFSDSDHNRTIYVAWLNPIDTTETESLRLPFEEGTVWDIYGNTTDVLDQDDGSNDGRIKVKVTGHPIYVVVDN